MDRCKECQKNCENEFCSQDCTDKYLVGLHNQIMMEKIHNESDRYAVRRKLSYKKFAKKITGENLRSEIIIARFLGEMSGAERILEAITADPEWTREDIEAEMHLFIKNLNNIAANMLNTNRVIDLEDVLEIHGYFKEEKS